MGKVILKNAVKRQKGKMYYVNAGGDLCEATMNRTGGKRKTTKSKPKTKAKKKTSKK
jgi:hypothetical protein